MSQAQQPEALRLAAWLQDGTFHRMTLGDAILAGRELRAQHARIAALEQDQAALAATQAAPAAPAKYPQMLVDAGALQMVVNALRRDAEEGKKARGEMADELLATATPAAGVPAAAPDARDAALWREHVSKLDALVTYCPTCCQGFAAKRGMSRDEVIFECGKASARAAVAAPAGKGD